MENQECKCENGNGKVEKNLGKEQEKHPNDKLLVECASGCTMAINSIQHVKSYAKDIQLIEKLNEYELEHVDVDKDIREMMSEYEQQEDIKKMASVCSWMNIEVKMSMHPNDSEVAKLMMDGCNMGIQTICAIMNECKEADEKVRTLAKRLVMLEERLMADMKAFV